MSILRSRRSLTAGLLGAIVLVFSSVSIADIDPQVLTFKKPDQLKWVDAPSGSSTAILFGDPDKPGWYGLLTKWRPGRMSRPHFHQYDRYVTVISGTWWIGTGPKFDPAATVPMPPGSFVRHIAKQIHWDGAKDEEVVLQIVGEGPATSIPAETK